ncbi:MAG TPA: glutathione peroxidase [Cytophagaceae bacterium]|jgi:glutathione peroxidase|nr:glutathione peroxidase [Cytophagaceae bacterium]
MLTTRQKITKALYPIIMFLQKNNSAKGKILLNTTNIKPHYSFYNITAIANNGTEISMRDFKGKKIMVVNVASNCGYTGQYDELEKLFLKNSDHLILLGFPANDFNNQESGSDKEIEHFCRINYGVTFPLFKKQSVLKPNQNEVYQWLTDKKRNGWNDQEPVWNFCKYVIDENGTLTSFFGSAISPQGIEIKNHLGI